MSSTAPESKPSSRYGDLLSDPGASLQVLQDRYISENPKSKAVHEKACEYLPGGNTRSALYYKPFPMTLAGGRGCYVTSVDGREYIDCVSEFTAGLFGHSHPVIQEAFRAALDKGINLGGHIEAEAELAKHVVSRFRSVEKVRFCNSGTEANTFALAVAKGVTRRDRIMVMKNGYHGGTLTFTDLNNPLILPHKYAYGTFNDIEATRREITPDIGAIVVEPMQGNGGLIMAQKEFLQFLRDTATKIGAVLIFDEVITSRLHFNGLQEHFGVYPDMTTLGKYIGGGSSFGAFGGRKEIMDRLDPRLPIEQGGIPHSGTYNNNTFSMLGGVAASMLVTPTSIARCNGLGNRLRQGFRDILREQRIDFIRIVGYGSLVGVHFNGPYAHALQNYYFFFLLDHGIYAGKRGFINFNLAHDESHVDEILAALKSFADSLVSGRSRL